VRRRRLALAGVAVVVLVLAGLAVAGVRPSSSSDSNTTQTRGGHAGGAPAVAQINPTKIPANQSGPATAPQRSATSSAPTSSTSSGATNPTAPASAATSAASAAASLRTSCKSVVHIGDSTSEGLDSSVYLPDRAQRIGAQYRRVGVKHVDLEITGATSIVETLPGGTNAYDVTKALLRHGYNGCWVIALGTNDSADVYVGSNVGLSQRVHRMMAAIGNQPALWVNDRSLVSSGAYSEADMQKWNHALVQGCLRYPSMRVYDWASAVKDNWFTTDGIHFTSAGYASRAHLIANALARAFPASGTPAPGCLVHTKSLSIRLHGA
jgi:hypothetical protein